MIDFMLIFQDRLLQCILYILTDLLLSFSLQFITYFNFKRLENCAYIDCDTFELLQEQLMRNLELNLQTFLVTTIC